MSSCNFIRQILPSECIGDSLVTINSNFSALDVGLCETPRVGPGMGTDIHFDATEQFRNQISISTKNSFQYITDFDSTKIAFLTGELLRDNSTIKIVRFPYKNSITDIKPEVTFSSVALTNVAPTVTL